MLAPKRLPDTVRRLEPQRNWEPQNLNKPGVSILWGMERISVHNGCFHPESYISWLWKIWDSIYWWWKNLIFKSEIWTANSLSARPHNHPGPRGSVINGNSQIVIWTSSEFQWRLASSSSIVIKDNIGHQHLSSSSSSFFHHFSIIFTFKMLF